MKIIVLASGSKGNSTYIETKETKILIDFGLSYTQTKNRLKKHDINIEDIKNVIITHTHCDHIAGLSSFAKKNKAQIFSSKKIYKDLIKIVDPMQIEEVDPCFEIEDLKVELFHLSHDVPVIGILIQNKSKELVYITDTGYINSKHKKKLSNKDFYIIESNYNEDMLLNGPYPYHLQRRIIGDSGHLSNVDAGSFLKDVIGDKTKKIVLAHISEHNNSSALAFDEVSQIIDNIFDSKNLFVSSQTETLIVNKEK